MRHQYTPLFRDLLTSSLWIADAPTRCVWIWMLLSADPEGYVCATLPGLALAANVTLEQARNAIEIFEAPDPYSSTPTNEGRRVTRVERGWHIINFVAWRERAKEEGEKARKRRWAKQKYADERQLTLPYMDGAECSSVPEIPEFARPLAEPSESLDAPKPIPKPIPKPKEEGSGSPLPPTHVHHLGEDLKCQSCGAHMDELAAGSVAIVKPFHEEQVERWRAIDPKGEEPFPQRFRTLHGLDETGLEDEAVMAGMSREWFRERLAAAKNMPIGGYAGVLDQREWVRLQLGRWKTWEEDARAKASGRRQDASPPAPTQTHARIPGCPAWVRQVHADCAEALGFDIKGLRALGRAFAKGYHLPVKSLHPNDIEAPFLDFIRQQTAKEVA